MHGLCQPTYSGDGASDLYILWLRPSHHDIEIMVFSGMIFVVCISDRNTYALRGSGYRDIQIIQLTPMSWSRRRHHAAMTQDSARGVSSSQTVTFLCSMPAASRARSLDPNSTRAACIPAEIRCCDPYDEAMNGPSPAEIRCWFCRQPWGEEAPAASTLQENIRRIRPETWARVNQMLMGIAVETGVETGKKVRVDCTVTDRTSTPLTTPSNSMT